MNLNDLTVVILMKRTKDVSKSIERLTLDGNYEELFLKLTF